MASKFFMIICLSVMMEHTLAAAAEELDPCAGGGNFLRNAMRKMGNLLRNATNLVAKLG